MLPKLEGKVYACTQMEPRGDCDEIGEVGRTKCEWNVVLNKKRQGRQAKITLIAAHHGNGCRKN